MSRPVPKPKDRLKFELNTVTGKLDLVSEFNADRIVTHQLTAFGSPIMMYDPNYGAYYEAESQVVTDSNGNVVVV
jgi:hypothetical protein